MCEYAKVIVMGSPISKSNFKMHNSSGRAILPENTGTYHDRYANYEESIAAQTRAQNPGVTMEESLIAVLRVYYKSEKRHPDTNNITKSIFDGIEKSGLIRNDAQVRRLIIEEYYDKVEPRFELELFAESVFRMSYEIRRHDQAEEPILYEPPSNRKSPGLPAGRGYREADLKKIQAAMDKKNQDRSREVTSRRRSAVEPPAAVQPVSSKNAAICSICQKPVAPGQFIKADGGKTMICKKCFKKLY